MRIKLLFIFFIFVLKTLIHAQDLTTGEYEVCFDSLSNDTIRQFCLNIVLDENGTYNLQLRNENNYHTSVGTWKKDSDRVILSPEYDANYIDLHNDLLDKLIPGRFLKTGEESLIWEVSNGQEIISRQLKKIRKCNC